MQDSPQTKPSLVLVLALWVAGLGAAAQFAKVSVIFPELQAHYRDAGPELGLLVSLIGFLGIGLGLMAGLIVARFGFRRLLIAALLLGAAVSAFQGTLPALPVMLASRLVEGASHLVIVVAAPTLIALSSSGRFRAMAMTLWSTFFGVSFALVAWFGIPLVREHGLQSLFIVHGASMLCAAIVLALLLPRVETGSGGEQLDLAKILRLHLQTYGSPSVAAPAYGWLFYTLTFVSLLTILPEFVPPENRAFVAGAMPLASIAVSLICGVVFLPRFSAVRTVMAGFAVSICVLPFLLSAADKSWACITLFGALGLVQGSTFAAVPQLNNSVPAQAHANGALAQMGNLGNTCGTPAILGLLAAFGFHGLVWAAGACFIAGIAIHLAMGVRRRTVTT